MRGRAAQLLEAVLELPVVVEQLSTSQQVLPGGFERITTTVELHGSGHVGRGEDIAYSADTQRALPAAFAALPLAGEWTIRGFSEHLNDLQLDLPPTPAWDDKPGYHRWALESAVLDLALRQAGTNLAHLVGASYEPVRVSLSMGLGDPPSAGIVEQWLARDASITFKLDVSADWTAELVADLARTGAVSTIDFKALYTGSWANTDYPPALYRTIAEGLPDALLEDAKLEPAIREALDGEPLQRLTWDFPITKPADVPGLAGSTAPFSDLRPKATNIKPSRFGTVQRLLETIALCDREQIPCYSGGQFELGIGRTQVQEIASLCFADAPNDCAPVLLHGATPESDVPTGPVDVPDHLGFGWDAPTPAQPL